MGFALKLSDVNFSGVAVDQVQFVGDSHCTAIALDQDTLSFESVNETKTLVATLTPAYTTDPLTWASSNENVASVVDGVVTIHGIGTATITATCGEQTATASVNQESIKPLGGSKLVSDCHPDTYSNAVDIEAGSGQKAFGQDYNADDTALHALFGNTYGVQLIPVPYGATKAKVAITGGSAVNISYMYIANMNDLVTVSNAQYPKYIERKEFVNTGTGGTVEYGQCIMFRPTDSQATTLDYVYFT